MKLFSLPQHSLDNGLTATIEELLLTDPVPLRHGGEFTGKPTTRVHVGDTHVVKLRALGLDMKHAGRYALERVYIESRLGVHHLHKRWFLVEEDGTLLLGNVTPRMISLAGIAEREPDRLAGGIHSAMRLYIHVARDWKLRLDEGLSNFGFTADGRLYYLDDDVFPWHGDVPLVSHLAVLLRMARLLDDAQWKRLGAGLRDELRDWLGDDGLHGLARRLEDELLPNSSQQARRDSFFEGIGIAADTFRPPVPVLGQRFALLADIHANLPALQAVLEDMDKRGVANALVLGDTVGYGPHPEECIAVLRERGWCVIKGNHDNAVAAREAGGYLSADARHVVDWTRERLSADDIAWLAHLPEKLACDDWMAVHGAPMDPTCFTGYVYDMTYEANLEWMRLRDMKLCLHGHSHMRGVYFSTRRGMGRDSAEQVSIAEFDAALVCPGSVGQPRDGSRGARYAILDLAAGKLEHVCVGYDVQRTQADMRAAGFPDRLAGRLDIGR